MKDRSGPWLAAIVLVGLCLRLLPLLVHGEHAALFMDFDSWGYHTIAQNLLAGNGYSWESQPPYIANVYRPPGLPGILTALYGLTSATIAHAILLQVLVSTLTVALTYQLARVIGASRGMALVAAALLAVDPVTIYYTNFLLTEAYSALIVVAALILGARYLQTGRHRHVAAIGVLLAVGIIIHPILIFAPAIVVALPLFSARCRSLRHVGVAGLAAALAWTPASAWIVRNHEVADYRSISCVSAVNLLKYKAAGVRAELNGTTRELERDLLVDEIQVPPDATRGARWRAWEQKALTILREHPGIYAWVHLKGMVRELLGPERDCYIRFTYGPPTIDADGRVSDDRIQRARAEAPIRVVEWLRLPVLTLQGVMCLLWLMGGLRLLTQRRWLLAMALLLPAMYVLILTGGPEGSPRFRTIYTPGLCVLGALGVQTIRTRLKARPDSFRVLTYERVSWLDSIERHEPNLPSAVAPAAPAHVRTAPPDELADKNSVGLRVE